MKRIVIGVVAVIVVFLLAYALGQAQPKEAQLINIRLPRLDLNVPCADSMTVDECAAWKALQKQIEGYVNDQLRSKWEQMLKEVNVQISLAHEASR